jgi:hypothetical protein
VDVDAQTTTASLADHVLGAARGAIPEGDERVGLGGHLDVAQDASGAAPRVPIGDKASYRDAARLGPRLTEAIDASGAAGEDEGDGVKAAGVDGLREEVRVVDATAAGDDELHEGAWMCAVRRGVRREVECRHASNFAQKASNRNAEPFCGEMNSDIATAKKNGATGLFLA